MNYNLWDKPQRKTMKNWVNRNKETWRIVKWSKKQCRTNRLLEGKKMERLSNRSAFTAWPEEGCRYVKKTVD